MAMSKRALEDFLVGETAVFSRTFTEVDVAQFVGITWDVNPYHTDEKFCETERVGKTRGWARIEMNCVNPDGQLVARGAARGYPARHRVRARQRNA
jgi:hypothetical protein